MDELKLRFPKLWDEFMHCIVCYEYHNIVGLGAKYIYNKLNDKKKNWLAELVINMALWKAKVEMFGSFFSVIHGDEFVRETLNEIRSDHKEQLKLTLKRMNMVKKGV